jgi:hypothetical protein
VFHKLATGFWQVGQHTALKMVQSANNSVRHLPLVQLQGRGQRRAFAQNSREFPTELLVLEKRRQWMVAIPT